MMASPSELSLRSLGDTTHQPPSEHLHTQKLEEQLSRLEEERLKIDAFKRELPLCMQLLTNAVEASRQQLQYCKASTANQVKGPVLEEFIPIKQPNSEALSDQQQASNISSDKANWMTSAQLWSQANDGAVTKQLGTHPSNEPGLGFNPGLSLSENNNKKQMNGGAFLPFTKERSSNSINHVLPELSLTSDEHEVEDKKGLKSESELASENSDKNLNGGFMVGGNQTNVAGATNTTSSPTTTTQTNRKQRRCWSPDLHRRFVNALQMLGGSQVATPKQIRELMKVDGLTNDEVKSHLQKYRLHTRRPGPSPQATGPPGPQLVVLGGIWVPPEYANAAHHHNGPQPAIYGAHPTAQMASHYCPPRIPQEFYPPPLPQALPQLRHQIHIYKDPSQGHGSPESGGGRGARDRSESIEDGKSESGSWKGDSGDESSEERKRKKLASMKEGDEESNGSEITLKF